MRTKEQIERLKQDLEDIRYEYFDQQPIITAFDIETAPNTAHVWGLFKQNIGLNQIQQTGRVMCFAHQQVRVVKGRAKPVGKCQFESELEGHERMIKAAWNVLDAADFVVHYNGARFDVPTLNREFLKYGLYPPSPYVQIDLLRTARKEFRFASNKLDHLLKELGLGGKVRHVGHEMWTECMAGNAKMWDLMERYNRGDVTKLIKLYDRMIPWIKNHPSVALYKEYNEQPTCTCGSTNLQYKGIGGSSSLQYKRYRCRDCGSPVQGRFAEARGDRRNILK